MNDRVGSWAQVCLIHFTIILKNWNNPSACCSVVATFHKDLDFRRIRAPCTDLVDWYIIHCLVPYLLSISQTHGMSKMDVDSDFMGFRAQSLVGKVNISTGSALRYVVSKMTESTWEEPLTQAWGSGKTCRRQADVSYHPMDEQELLREERHVVDKEIRICLEARESLAC